MASSKRGHNDRDTRPAREADPFKIRQQMMWRLTCLRQRLTNNTFTVKNLNELEALGQHMPADVRLLSIDYPVRIEQARQLREQATKKARKAA